MVCNWFQIDLNICAIIVLLFVVECLCNFVGFLAIEPIWNALDCDVIELSLGGRQSLVDTGGERGAITSNNFKGKWIFSTLPLKRSSQYTRKCQSLSSMSVDSG